MPVPTGISSNRPAWDRPGSGARRPSGVRGVATRPLPVLLTALTILVAGCGRDTAGTEAPSTSTTIAADAATSLPPVTTAVGEPTTTRDARAEREVTALGRVERLLDAIVDGDVDGALGGVRTWMEEPQRERLGFVIALGHFRPGDCDVTSSSGFVTTVVCSTEIVDPVFLRTGPAEGVDEYQVYADGVAGFNGGITVARQYADAATAYATWLQSERPDAYAATCDPDGYDQPIESEYGLALTTRCGALLATVSDDVAAWMDARGAVP